MALVAASVDPVVTAARRTIRRVAGVWRHQRRIFAACAAAALLYSGFYIARDATNGNDLDVIELSTRAGAEWLAWAVLAPLAWWAAERWRVTSWRATRALARHALMAAALAIGQALLFWLLLQLRQELHVSPVRLLNFVRGDDPRFLATRFDSNLVIYGCIVAIATATRRGEETAAAHRERIETERQLLAARLEALRQQLSPHFLLNALNAFLGALGRRPVDAARILRSLIRLLSRHDARTPLVTLDDELELVRTYAAIEEVRFRDRLLVEWAIDPVVAESAIPPFALQTLFENAIRHATHRDDHSLHIRVSAQRNDDRVVIRVANDGRIGGGTGGGTGIGLANLSARLTLLFDGDASVELYETGDRTVASISLPSQP